MEEALNRIAGSKELAVGMAQLQAVVHEIAIEKGWWTTSKTFGEQVALFHSELSEALEEYRTGHDPEEWYYGVHDKPEGVPIELADCVIRIMDTCERYNIDLLSMILEKMRYNMTRPYRHGGKKI